MAGELQKAGLKSTLNDAQNELTRAIGAIRAISNLPVDIKDDESTRLQNLKTLLEEIKSKIKWLSDNREFDEATKNLIRSVVNTLYYLNLDLTKLHHAKFHSKDENRFISEYGKRFTSIDSGSKYEIQRALSSIIERPDAHYINIGAIFACLASLALLIIATVFIAPYAPVGLAGTALVLVGFALCCLAINVLRKACLSRRQQFNDAKYEPIRSLGKSAIALSEVRLYQQLPALTAHKISQALEHDSPPLDKLDGLTTFVFAKDQAGRLNVCETLIARGDNFSIAKNNGTAGGHIIGISRCSPEFHLTLQEHSIPYITSACSNQHVHYNVFDRHEEIIPESHTESAQGFKKPYLKLYSSPNFPQGVEFEAMNVHIHPNHPHAPPANIYISTTNWPWWRGWLSLFTGTTSLSAQAAHHSATIKLTTSAP